MEVKAGEVDLARGVDFTVLHLVGEIHLLVKCVNDGIEPQARDANVLVGRVEDGVDFVAVQDDGACLFINFKLVGLRIRTESDRLEGD